jgi:predicted nuclease of predicted toxin-antitoxin system
MRFLTNENISVTVVRVLREHGYDVLAVKDSMRSETDDAILARAQAEGRLVVTQDKDFGELAFRSRLPAPCGIVLFRLGGVGPDSDNRRMLEVLESDTDWAGNMVVATDTHIRIRPLPPPKRMDFHMREKAPRYGRKRR